MRNRATLIAAAGIISLAAYFFGSGEICAQIAGKSVTNALAAPPITVPPALPAGTGTTTTATDKPLAWCIRGDGLACSDAELSDPVRYRQIAVLPTGYSAEAYETFRADFDRLVRVMSDGGGQTYTATYPRKILYQAFWMPGGPIDSDTAVFHAKIAKHPTRGKALALKQNEVTDKISGLKASAPKLKPWGVLVLYNTMEEGITANASPPVYLDTGYGIARITKADLEDGYTGIHELAHAALNFLDEYVENGFGGMSISSFDMLTPFIFLDGTFAGLTRAAANAAGLYNYLASEIVAANGNDNIDVTPYVSRVGTPGYPVNNYEDEGGMFFGKGTWHDSGENIMESRYYYTHSFSQQEVIRQVFTNPGVAPRPNDRIRNAGPLKNWLPMFGGNITALIFDADKYHQFHPTTSYEVQVGWNERVWKVCKWKWVSYPCMSEKFRTVAKTLTPQEKTVSLGSSSLYKFAALIQKVVCSTNFSAVRLGSYTVDPCTMTLAELTTSFLPSLKIRIPYQEVPIPTSQGFTTYYWRFRTSNGTYQSGFTGWMAFYKAF